MKGWQRGTAVVAGLAAWGGLGLATAQAVITPVPLTFANRFEYSFVAGWTLDFDPPEEGATLGFTRGLDKGAWKVVLTSPPQAGGPKDLIVGVTHVRPPHAGEGMIEHAPFSLDDIERPAMGTLRQAKAVQFSHPGVNPAHLDVARVLVQAPAGMGEAIITSTGQHVRPNAQGRGLAEWSLLGVNGRFKVFQIGGAADGERIDNGPAGGSVARAGRRQAGRLDAGATGYRVDFTTDPGGLPDPTFTTLAFLGEVDGAPGMLNLEAGLSLFLDHDTFFAPLLSDPTGADLYVGIDLTQWLSIPTPFTIGDTFSFSSSGMSDMLPGIMVGSSPVEFDPVSGQFTTANPVGGDFMVSGIIDGRRVIPEPATALTLLAGLVACGLARRRPGSPDRG